MPFEDFREGVMFMYYYLMKNSYLYHKARKCHFASASTVCGVEASAEAHKCEHLQNIFQL
jgi:hypothetical protein